MRERRRARRWLWCVASSVLTLVLLAVAAAILASDREPRTLNDSERSRLPGRFVALSQGFTNYEIMGPETGPVVLLVIAFDLYGRGFSDRPRVRYDAALFNQQIDELLATLRIEGRVTLVGLASGELQSLLYAESRPKRVESLVLIVRQFRGQLDYKGFWRALVSSIASLPISESSDLFRRIERQGTRTLVVWGSDDVIIPTQLGHEVRRLMPSAAYVEIPAGQLPQYERPDATSQAILRFLIQR